MQPGARQRWRNASALHHALGRFRSLPPARCADRQTAEWTIPIGGGWGVRRRTPGPGIHHLSCCRPALLMYRNYMEAGVLMRPQAILAPELPEGSVIMSSAFS